MPTREGGRMPVHCTSMGKAMLAFAGENEIARTIKRADCRVRPPPPSSTRKGLGKSWRKSEH
jgi:DNA-binding IclR family transcriptional regulator